MKANRLLVLAALSFTALVGCNQPKKDKLEIVIWTTYNDTYQAIINNCIEEFKESQYDILADTIRQNMDMDYVYSCLKEAKITE